jgi:hypothetical protein
VVGVAAGAPNENPVAGAGAGAGGAFSTGFCPNVKADGVAAAGAPNEKPAGLSTGFASGLAPNNVDEAGDCPKVKPPGVCGLWPKGDDAPGRLKENPPAFNLGNSGLTLSSVDGRTGLSSIITSEFSFFGGVSSRAGGVPNMNPLLASGAVVPFVGMLNPAGVPVVVGVPKLKGLFSFAGVDGAAPNEKAVLICAGGVAMDWPKVNPPAGFGASVGGAGVDGAEIGACVAGWPNVNMDFAGSGVEEAAGAKPENGVTG